MWRIIERQRLSTRTQTEDLQALSKMEVVQVLIIMGMGSLDLSASKVRDIRGPV